MHARSKKDGWLELHSFMRPIEREVIYLSLPLGFREDLESALRGQY